MSIKTRFIDKRTMKAVNVALANNGYVEYPGDRTTAHPAGQGSGYVSNLVDYLAPGNDYKERSKIENIVAGVINR